MFKCQLKGHFGLQDVPVVSRHFCLCYLEFKFITKKNLVSQIFSIGHLQLFDITNSQLRKENPCGPIPPPVQVKETEVITEEAVITTLKRALSFFSSIQAHDGHWPVESAGPLYFLQPMVCIFKPFVSKKHTLSLSLYLCLRK